VIDEKGFPENACTKPPMGFSHPFGGFIALVFHKSEISEIDIKSS
jgi:hypothetical protein